MSVIWIVLPLALLFGAIAVVVFLLAVRDGQMDELDTASMRMLFDDMPASTDDKTASEDLSASDTSDNPTTSDANCEQGTKNQ